MPEWVQIMIAMMGAAGGGAGVAQYLRARGQNRVDERGQLTEEQRAFREDMRAEIARLDQKNADTEKRNDVLEAAQLESVRQIAALQSQNTEQGRQIEEQGRQLVAQQQQIGAQRQQIESLISEKAALANEAFKASATARFLEKENNALRLENAQLRAQQSARHEEGTP